ncbi:MAG: rhomboid family intramembrane serine protease [Bacteroidia bacterium]
MNLPAVLAFRRGYVVTPVLLILNVGIWLVMVLTGVHFMEPSGESLVNWGSNYGELTLNGEPWRMVTGCFIHIGIIHLLLNMYALLSLGDMLEKMLGSMRFAILYLVCGISGSALSLWWNDGMMNAAGASGAIFGLAGIFLALLTTNLIQPDVRGPMLKSMLAFVGYNLVFGLMGRIDNAAHIGGLLGGIIGGYCVWYDLIQWHRYQKMIYLGIAGGVLLVLAASFVLFQQTAGKASDVRVHVDAIQQFSEKAFNQVQRSSESLGNVQTRSFLEAYQAFDSCVYHFDAGKPETYKRFKSSFYPFCQSASAYYKLQHRRSMGETVPLDSLSSLEKKLDLLGAQMKAE